MNFFVCALAVFVIGAVLIFIFTEALARNEYDGEDD